MRFQRVTAALDAVLANAGVTLGGLALLSGAVEDGRIALPYPIATGIWSDYGFIARFRADAEARRHVRRFRSWLAEEARATSDWLARKVPAGTQ
jgi:LysR family glycine cleavage system transcriptional activator